MIRQQQVAINLWSPSNCPTVKQVRSKFSSMRTEKLPRISLDLPMNLNNYSDCTLHMFVSVSRCHSSSFSLDCCPSEISISHLLGISHQQGYERCVIFKNRSNQIRRLHSKGQSILVVRFCFSLFLSIFLYRHFFTILCIHIYFFNIPFQR